MDRTVILAANRRARCAVEAPAKPEPAERGFLALRRSGCHVVLRQARRRGVCGPRSRPALNPVDGAYHLGGIGGQRGNINNFLLGHLWGVDRI
ncbi:MAG: hypothetical protein OXH06_05230 [Gemmatimonadetes bacterium]|nr:hypothetical protein [Gemmatimonadota bacterium]